MSVAQPLTPSHPILHTAYRPFFLAAMLHAIVIMMFWQIDTLRGNTLASIHGQQGWHTHEMTFGFAIAFLAGFLLHATRNWTGINPIDRKALFGVVILWLAGRFLPFFPDLVPPTLAGIPDLLFLLVLTAIVAAPLIQRRSTHAYALIEVLLILCGASVIIYWADTGLLPQLTLAGERLALYGVVAMLVILAGKLIPGFAEQTLGFESRSHRYDGIVENTAIASLYLLMILLFVIPDGILTALVACTAAISNALRLKRWYFREIWRHPLLWALYCGYGWISAGLLLLAAGTAGLIPSGSGLHALGIGGIGLSAAGMMSRVMLTNDGTARTDTDSWLALAFILLNISAISLAIGPLILPEAGQTWLLIGGMSWVTAFAVLAWCFVPPLMTPTDHQLS